MSQQPFKHVERRLAGTLTLWTTQDASSRMSHVRRHGTNAELSVRQAARVAGIRFTAANTDLPGTPDLVNRRRKLVVFVHGCYWHRHARCAKATTPTSNKAFWLAKFAHNVARDRRVQRELRALGYRVITVWECQAVDAARVARRIAAAASC